MLTSLLREKVHPSARCEGLRRASVGNSQETWFFDAVWDGGSRPLVLRRSAADGTLTWTDRRVEYEALQVVGAAGLPVPPVVWLDAGGGVLERPYFVMERLAGTPPRDAAVSFELGSLLAKVHAVPVSWPTGDELGRWHERYLATRLGAMPLLGALFAWLQANPPPAVAPVLLWGDAGPHNLLVDEGRITGLLDWELAHAGHRLEDVGAAQWACFGTLDEDEILAGYESVAGPVDRDALRWFRCFACVTRTVMLLASNRAWVQGTVQRPSLAALGLDLVSRNLRRAAHEARWDDAAILKRDSPSLDSARPDASEVAAGLARFLAADLLPATEDRALRRELKNAVALLETIALQTRGEHVDQADLEDEARRRELAHDPSLRTRLLADHAAADEQLAPLRNLFRSRDPGTGRTS
jgi:aminoglycoside phosphotransferase (APT) family kinase protein